MDVNEWRSAFSVQRSAFGGAVRRVGVSACRRNDMVVAPHRVEPFNCAESLMVFAVYGDCGVPMLPNRVIFLSYANDRAYRGRLERLISG
jgi:hypothetical protein